MENPGQFSLCIAQGVILTTHSLIFLILLYHICRINGLGQAHFQWDEAARRTLKRNLSWLIPTIVVFAFFLEATKIVPELKFSDALAKLSLIMNSLAISIFTARTLRFSGGITSELIEKYPRSWLCRLRYIWYPLAIFLPQRDVHLDATGPLDIRVVSDERPGFPADKRSSAPDKEPQS